MSLQEAFMKETNLSLSFDGLVNRGNFVGTFGSSLLLMLE